MPQDFYATPPEVTKALVNAEYERLECFSMMWKPAAGDGAMAKVLRKTTIRSSARDIADRGCPHVRVQSFFDYDRATCPRAHHQSTVHSEVNWRDGKGRLDARGWREKIWTSNTWRCCCHGRGPPLPFSPISGPSIRQRSSTC